MNAVLMQSWNSFLGMESTLFINDAMGFNRNTSTKDQQISPPKMMLDFLLGVFHLRNLPKIDVTDLEGDRWMLFFFPLEFWTYMAAIHPLTPEYKGLLLRTRKLAEEQLKQFWRPRVFLEMFFVTHRNSIIEADAWYFQDL